MSNNQSATKTKLKITSEKFIWKIDNFSERPEKCGEYFQSSEFTSTAPNGKHLKWQLKMYPNGGSSHSKLSKDYVGISLHLIEPKNKEVKAKYQISISKSDGDHFLKPFDNKYLNFFNFNSPDWGAYALIKREELLNEKNGYLDRDRLTIVFELMVHQESQDIEVPECQAAWEDMSHLYEKSLFTDCKIISEDDKVHKNILWCRSPVFRAMFEHKMTENINNVINIVDMKGEVIEQMLRYIYSGKKPDLLEEMAEDLLFAADKYELPHLTLLCERKLVNSIEIANACRLLVLANRYSAKHLKETAINFIKIYGNEVMASEEWKELADTEVMEQILKAVIMGKQI